MSNVALGLPRASLRSSIVVFAIATLALPTAAKAQPPAAPPAAPAAPAPPAAAPPVVKVAKAVKLGGPHRPKPKVDPLPEPEIRARIIAPSGTAPWTFRLENEGQRWLRVPADLRLLHLTVEGGDTVSRKGIERPVKCGLPGALRLSAFPEASALLLGPGDAYVETFDPRLFCFGKEAKRIEGGAIIHATYGWDEGPANAARKLGPPFAVEGTAFPPAVEPKKHLVVPSLVVNWLTPDSEAAPPSLASPDLTPPPGFSKPLQVSPLGSSDLTPPPGVPKPLQSPVAPPAAPEPEEADPSAPRHVQPVDENAPRFEVSLSPYSDAATGRSVSLTVTVKNVGHRAAMAAIRPRMLSYRVEGPSHQRGLGPSAEPGSDVSVCPADPRINVPREGFQSLRAGGSTSFTLLVDEACGRELFARPGLYRLSATLRLNESGSAFGLAAMTGRFRATAPMWIRVADGSEPFYRSAPTIISSDPTRTPPPPGGAGEPAPPATTATPATPATPAEPNRLPTTPPATSGPAEAGGKGQP